MHMKTLLTLSIALFFFSVSHADSHAEDRLELGLGVGPTYPLAGGSFKDLAKKGNNQNYWIGYGLEDNFGVELGVDIYDFDQIDTHHQAVSLAGVYRFLGAKSIHPLVKLGLSNIQSKLSNDGKVNSFGGKIAGGFEVDFKNISLGGLVNYYYISSAGDADIYKNVQSIAPVLFISFHDNIVTEMGSTYSAPAATASPNR